MINFITDSAYLKEQWFVDYFAARYLWKSKGDGYEEYMKGKRIAPKAYRIFRELGRRNAS